MSSKDEKKYNSQIIPIKDKDYSNPNIYFESPFKKVLIYSQNTNRDGDTKDDLVCNICRMVVYNPVNCKSCNNIFCTSCITKQQISNLRCPTCNEDYEALITVSLIKNRLNSLRFYCPYSRTGKNN